MPAWLAPSSAVWLLGGQNTAHVREALNAEGVASGKLQKAIEDEIDDYIPCKRAALLMAASLQRCAIQVSNGVFYWESYPTFYGSYYVYFPEQRAVGERALSPQPALLEKLETFAWQLVSLAQAYPETSFCMVLADQSNVSAANPTSQLVSGARSCAEYAALLSDWMHEASNVIVTAEPYDDLDRYYHDYYRGDHHWNGYGALKVYEKLADLYGLPAAQAVREYDSMQPGLEDIIENGSFARYSLTMVNEPASEPLLDLFDLALEEGSPAPVLDGDLSRLFSQGGSVEHNFYEAWYGYRGTNRFHNSGGVAGRAMLVCDSFGTAIKYPLACGFEYLDVVYSLHGEVSNAPSLATMLEEAQPDIVFFVGRLDNYADSLNRSPLLLEVA